MILRPFTILLTTAFLLLLLLLRPEESEAWTTTNSASLPKPPRSAFSRPTPILRLSLSKSDYGLDFIDCSIEKDGETHNSGSNNNSNSSRRRWLGSLAATVAAGVSSAVVAPQLPSHAEATLVSSKSVCDATVSVWSKNGRIIYLLGTAHISNISAELAGALVKETNPKGVFIELDPKRVSGKGALAQKFQGDESTPMPQRESKIIVPQISQVPGDGGLVLAAGPPSEDGAMVSMASPSPQAATKQKQQKQQQPDNNPVMKAATAAVGKQLKGMYSRLDSAGFDSGEEFVRAVQEGKKLGADIVLGDRDVEVTLRRVTEGLARTDLKAFLSPDSELERTLEEMVPVSGAVGQRVAGTGGSDMSDAEFKEELTAFVETMKTKDNVKKIMGQLQRVAPFLYEALVSERDVYMATGLNGLNELETIVAVVGIAHADGIETTLQQNGWRAANPKCSK
jgi:hypothetical protein